MKWSNYQEAIFAELVYGRGNVVVKAVAGSGKTTTIVEGANRVKAHNPHASVLFCAFNVDIVKVLAVKMPGTDCRTMNSLGHGLVLRALNEATRKKVKVNAYKYSDIVKTLLQDGYAGAFTGNGFKETNEALVDLVRFAMAFLSDCSTESLRAICDHYTLTDFGPLTEEEAFNLVKTALLQGEAQAKQGILSFDDQVWLPSKWNLIPQFKYDYVFVDECQDTSPAKLDLISRFVKD